MAAVLTAALLHGIQARAAGDAGRAILILDASGSMWGEIDGRAKIDIAKAVVAEVLATWRIKGRA